MIDVRAGGALDRHFAALLRSSGKPMILVANKAEGRGRAGCSGPTASASTSRWRSRPSTAGNGRPGRGAVSVRGFGRHSGKCARSPSGGGGQTNTRKSRSSPHSRRGRLLTGEAGITHDAIAVDWTARGIAGCSTPRPAPEAARQGKLEGSPSPTRSTPSVSPRSCRPLTSAAVRAGPHYCGLIRRGGGRSRWR